ncbi:MAG: DUF1501 domain-containing protein [Planctomycetia bacterium]|nr:DUF1501 domain-containing protein [Planctomycetia bacterium]
MHRHGCQREDHPLIGRRELLQVGGMSLFGAGLSDLLRLEAQAAAARGERAGEGGQDARPPDVRPAAKSIVFIFQSGGPSQHETFDPKPDAPDTIRGEYGTIATSLASVRFCEYLPKLAARAHRFSLVRSMHHVADRQFRNEHSSCHYLLHSGTTELPAGDTNASIIAPRPGRIAWPSIGSMIAFAAPPPASVGLPAVVEIPRSNNMTYPGREPGMLGPQYGRWGVDLAPPCHAKDPAGSCPNCFSHDDPNDPARAAGPGANAWWDNSSCRNPDFHLPDLGAVEGITIPHLSNRLDLLRRLEYLRRDVLEAASRDAFTAFDVHRDQALRLLLATQPGKHNPFDLTQEDDRTRDLYGREEWGQAFLVARRLVEAGVRMVQVNLRGWDTHQNAFRDLKAKLLPSIDHCLSGFLDDLADRGLLDETLIVMCGEMGRTPRISPIAVGGRNASGEIFTPGRHHWGDVFPCFFAGGGVQPGRVIGSSDRQAAQPTSDAYTPEDLAATIFHQLGIGPDREFQDTAGRPFRVYRGRPIAGLL